MIRKIAFLAALSMSVSANAQTIGLIDSGLHVNTKDVDNLHVEVIDRGVEAPQGQTKFGASHGHITLRTIGRGADGQPLTVLYASPFAPSAKGGNYMRVDWDRMIRNLHTMKARGVTLVCTTFVTNEFEPSRKFVEEAKALGMTVVASLGNGEVATPYPAMHSGVKAVFRSDWSADRYANLIARADYRESGRGGRKGPETIDGSSFAAARVCGQLAKGL